MLSLFGYLEPLKQLCLSIEQRYNRHKWSEIDGAPFIPKLRSLTRHAVIGGHLHILEWVHQRYFPHLNEVFYALATETIQYDRVGIAQFFGQHPEFRAFNNFPTTKNYETIRYRTSESMIHTLIKLFGITLPFKNDPDHIPDAMINHLNLDADGCLRLLRLFSVWSCGNLNMIKYLHVNGLPFHESTIYEAAYNGHLDVIKYLLENKSDTYICEYAMDNAARNGHLDTVRYLHEQRTEGCSGQAIVGAAENGHLDVIRFILENRTEVMDHKTAFESAAVEGHLSVVEYLHHFDSSVDCTNKALTYPATDGHAHIVQFICERFPSLRIGAHNLMNVSSRKVLEVLDRLMPSQIWEDDRIYNRDGDTLMNRIEYIIDNKSTEYIARCLNDKVFGKSMLLDQSKLFFKLIKHMVNLSFTLATVLPACLTMAPFCEHKDILENIYESCTQDGMGVPFLCPQVGDDDAEYVVLDALEFIHHKGGLQSPATIQHGILMGAIRFGRFDIVKFIMDTVGYRPSTHDLAVALFDRAISHGHVDILQFLLDKIGVDGQLPESRAYYAVCVDQAIVNGHLEMVRFISCERFKHLISMTAQSSFNEYLNEVLTKSASPDTPRFVEYMRSNHAVKVQESLDPYKIGHRDFVLDLDTIISINEAGGAYPIYPDTAYELDVLVGILLKQRFREVFANLPMAEIVLCHKKGVPFIQRVFFHNDLDHFRDFPLSLILLSKYLF
ncbi:hypothetical protein SAMD00019534_036100 [Acytostelium subglobosum LB1]|uniref:hypothetical protein n=1 Tax=Acytostelium subglobosum LB1 TaxID=1410327 RepID=UPI000644A7BF|nr:hypothetical protein SAMD00019534_036100 [Acytostelium subglobosum LB1]GAM20435.1 hypothetical protein SAMD00019534_036100 [Acytostelium subglobosum LB1]|eukprot:XP_012759956.1 hypothetical protein SAMD00019534_036100 [Acytostelium subglobosum LB1]